MAETWDNLPDGYIKPAAAASMYDVLFGLVRSDYVIGDWFTDSTGAAIVGAEASLYDHLQYQFFLHHGHWNPGIYPTFAWGQISVNPGDFGRLSLAGDGGINGSVLAQSKLMPGFYPGTATGYVVLAATSPLSGWGYHAKLNHDNNLEDTDYGFSQGTVPTNLGSAAFHAGTARGNKSMIDLDAGIFVRAYARAFDNGQAGVNVNADRVVIWKKPLNSLYGQGESANGKNLTAADAGHEEAFLFGTAAGKPLYHSNELVYAADTPVFADLGTTRRVFNFQYGGWISSVGGPPYNTNQGAQVVIRPLSVNKKGTILDAQGVAGHTSAAVLTSHANCGPWIAAKQSKFAIISYGINDFGSISVAQYKTNILALMDFLGDNGVTHFILMGQWTTVNAAANSNYAQYPGALYEIANMDYADIHADCEGVLFWNLRKVLEDDHAWNEVAGNDCDDNTGHLEHAGCEKVGLASVPNWITYLQEAGGGAASAAYQLLLD